MREREAVAEIGVFGGSGFYSLLEHADRQFSVAAGRCAQQHAILLGAVADRHEVFPSRGKGVGVPVRMPR